MNRRFVGLGVALGVILVAMALTSPQGAIETLEWLAADPIRFGFALIGVAVIRPVLVWPTTLVAVAVGYGYGWAGIPFGVLLLTMTALPPYIFGRAGRIDPDAEGRLGARITEAGERFVNVAGEARTVMATRLFPLPSDAISIGAGIAGVRLRPFLLGTAAGEFPWVVAGVAIGVSIDRLASGEGAALDPTLFVGMVGVAVGLLAGPFARAYRRQHGRLGR